MPKNTALHSTHESKIRMSIKKMIADGISPMSIVMAHGRIVTPDEAELLTKYEEQRNAR